MNSITLGLAAILGLCIGSFLNVIIYRLPLMLQQRWQDECQDYLTSASKKSTTAKRFNLAFPGSHCPKCKSRIKILQNIPLLSYIFLRGKCPNCKQPISVRYPIVELVSSILTIIVVMQFGICWHTLFILILTWSLIALVFIDYNHLILPDDITLPVLWLGLIINSFNLFTNPATAIIGAVAGYSSLWLVAFIFKLLRGVEGMGHGDFKLFALFGAWIGWQQLPLIIFMASLLGAIIGISAVILKKRGWSQPLPFGPYIALAGWTTAMWGQNIVNLYYNYIFLR